MRAHLCNKQLMHQVRQAVLRHEGLHDVLIRPALRALMRLHVQPLQRIVLAQPCRAAHLHAAMRSAVRALSCCGLHNALICLAFHPISRPHP